MIIRTLQRDKIHLLWQIDRREVIENIYYLCNGELILMLEYFDMQGRTPGKAEHYTFILFVQHPMIWETKTSTLTSYQQEHQRGDYTYETPSSKTTRIFHQFSHPLHPGM